MVSIAIRPRWLLANETCSRGCQSCAATIKSKHPELINSLKGDTIASAPGTGSAPPGRKSGCMSTTSKTARSLSILICSPFMVDYLRFENCAAELDRQPQYYLPRRHCQNPGRADDLWRDCECG